MENLLVSNYGSPDSSSSSKASRSSPPSRVKQRDRHVSLLANSEQNAVLFDDPNNSTDFGRDNNSTESSACTHGNRWCQNIFRRMDSSATDKRGEMDCLKSKESFDFFHPPNKRQKMNMGKNNEFQTRVLISVINSIDNNETGPLNSKIQFERTHPHWEGRWAGHIFFPLPPLENLDGVYCDTDDHHEESALQKAQNEDVDEKYLEKPANESESVDRENGDFDNDSDRRELNSSDHDDESVDFPQSRVFLPVARKLINYWAQLIEATIQVTGRSMASNHHQICEIKSTGKASTTINGEKEKFTKDAGVNIVSRVVIVPHFPMLPLSISFMNLKEHGNKSFLHVSLSRPIYLPAPSVDPFLNEISKQLRAVVSSTGKNYCQPNKGIVLQLQPRNATIFTNDQRTRSFLSIPVSETSAHWVKCLLLPRIDATMERFGQGSYYKTREGGCILHVSIASTKGDMLTEMLSSRRSREVSKDKILFSPGVDILDEPKSASLFEFMREDELRVSEISNNFIIPFSESIPELIPVQISQIRCEFGTTKMIVHNLI